MDGGSSRLSRGFSNGGDIIFENNICMNGSGFLHTKKAKSKSAWNPFSSPPLSVELPEGEDGCYLTRNLILRMNGKSTISNNVVMSGRATNDGRNGFDSYPSSHPDRGWISSIDIPDSQPSHWKQGEYSYDLWPELLDGVLFNYNEGNATIKPLSPFADNLGIQLSTYPTWNQLEALGKDWTDSFPPSA